MVNKDELKQIVKQFSEGWFDINDIPYRLNNEYEIRDFKQKNPTDLILYKSWISGGVSGGNCWGSDPTPFIGDPEPEFEIIDNVLQIINPSITYLNYKKLFKELENEMFTIHTTDYEYYGNSTDYSYQCIYFSKLYSILSGFNL